jgi:hypothetical protein
MTMRRRTKSSGAAGSVRKPILVNQAAVAPPKRAKPPLIEQFHVAIDRQLKTAYRTFEAAQRAALAINKQHPQPQVTVYDAKAEQHTAINQPKAGADPHKKSSHRVRSMISERRAAVGERH